MRNQQKELYAISDDGEMGLMNIMLTTTANDSSPELCSCIRRGPFAIPDNNEMIQYLLSRKRANRVAAEEHGVYHVISYQKRLNRIKQEFFARDLTTPIGKLQDWWDRTEAQQRGALHSHILCWFEKRTLPNDYKALNGIPREVKGNDLRQRPATQHVPELKEYQEDFMG